MPRVTIPDGNVELDGDLTLPSGAIGLVLFAHGSGSSRLSPRNQYVAGVLNGSGIATLLFDLLTPEEDEIYKTRFNIGLLTERLVVSTHRIRERKDVASLSLGYFGASTGAAAALQAAAILGTDVRAVVSRGGRPDLAGDALKKVLAPTLLLVGGNDDEVIELNRLAYAELRCVKKLSIVPGATHLFEEPGTLEDVARQASNWFLTHFVP